MADGYLLMTALWWVSLRARHQWQDLRRPLSRAGRTG